MHIDFLLEEPSAEAALRHLVPKIIGQDVTSRFLVHQGKKDLVDKLPSRLRGYRPWLPADWRIVVLLDADQQDCRRLKQQLEAFASSAQMATRSRPNSRGLFQVVNRLAIEELEAWFFGDTEAIAAAYPKIPRHLAQKARYRQPDAIAGGTWEALERVLRKAGYCRAGMPKIETAERISRHMDPDRNTSKSFQVFRDALRAIGAS